MDNYSDSRIAIIITISGKNGYSMIFRDLNNISRVFPSMLEKHLQSRISLKIIDITGLVGKYYEIPSDVMKRGWTVLGIFQKATWPMTPEGLHLEGTYGGFNIGETGLMPLS